MQKTIVRPSGVPIPRASFAPAVKAGPWVFTSGVLATDFDRGLPAQLRTQWAQRPRSSDNHGIMEADYVLDQLGAILTAAGSGLEFGVQIDQFASSRSVRRSFHLASNHRIPPPRRASMCVAVKELAWAHCSIEVQMIAATAESGVTVERVPLDQVSSGSTENGLSSIRAGDLVFVGGRLADRGEERLGDQTDANFANGEKIGHHLIRRRLDAVAFALQAAGSSMENVVKVRMASSDMTHMLALTRVWRELLPDEAPAQTLVPAADDGHDGVALDIGVIAVRASGVRPRRTMSLDTRPAPLLHTAAAVEAADIVFLSGLVAADQNGLIPRARVDANYTGIGERRQMEWILSAADELLLAAGSSIQQVVRVENYLSDLNHLPILIRAYDDWFGDQPPAITVVGVPTLYPQGCSVMIDILAVRR